MARKSQWQQFSDNFNSVYGSFNTAFKDFESKRVMEDEYTDVNGIALSGDELDSARYKALADVYTKYGDAAGGLALRSSQAALRAANFENDLNTELRPELLAQRGALKSGLLASQANSNNASAANSLANANRTSALTPLQVEQLGLNNQAARVGLDVAQATADDKIRASGAAADLAESEATTAGIEADTAEATKVDNVAAIVADLQATAAERGLQGQTAQLAARDQSIMMDIVSESLKRDFETPELANEWIVEQISKADMTPTGRAQMATTINQLGAANIVARATELTESAKTAYREGGLQGLADMYDSVADGVDGKIVRDGDTVSVVVDRGNGQSQVVAQASGENAEAIVATQVMKTFADPSSTMAMAAAELDLKGQEAANKRTNATAGLIDAQQFGEALKHDRMQAQTMLVRAQIEKVGMELKAAGQGISSAERERLALRTIAEMYSSPEFVLLSGAEQDSVRDRLRRDLGIDPAVPEGLTDAEWDAMTPKEQELFLRGN